MQLIKNGSRGPEVTELQNKLAQLGFENDADGIFGPQTEKIVRELQSLFGYTVDGIVGAGTMRLIDAQIGYGWNATAEDAEERALRSQGKTDEADALARARMAQAAAASLKSAKT